MRIVLWLAMATGAAAACRPAACAAAAQRRICDMWPKPGTQGCDGLLRVPLAQDNTTRAALGAKMAAALRRGRLTIAALGDSITAGHDNFYNQSWVPQLQGLLTAPLRELGIELFVENFAVGNMGEFPWTAGCLRHRLGDRLARSVDLVTWNWALYDDAPCAREHFLAEVAALPGQPIILQLQDHDVPLHACRGGSACGALKLRLDHDFWDAGARIWRENAFFLSEAYVPGDAEAALLAEINAGGGRGARRSGAGGGRGVRKRGRNAGRDELAAAAAALGESPPRAVLAPARAAAHFDAEALAWWTARGKAVNFLWHPGPLGHLLIASAAATWLLDGLRTTDSGERRAGPEPRGRPEPRVRCGRPTAWCSSLVVPSHGTPLDKHVAARGGWRVMEDAVEHDYRAHWSGRTAGYADSIDAKNALIGDRAAGALVSEATAPRDGLSILLCEAPCGSNGCEKHRGFVSFGPKKFWEATVSSELGQGEFAERFRERAAHDTPGGPARRPWQAGRRYSEDEIKQFRLDEQQRSRVSDVAVAVDGVPLPAKRFAALQADLDRVCPGCGALRGACAVVAANVTAGAHTISVVVTPKSFDDPEMHVAVSQIMVV